MIQSENGRMLGSKWNQSTKLVITFVNVENQNLYKPSSCHEPAQEILKNGKHWYLYFVDVSADKHIDICLVGEAVLPITIGQKASLCCFDTFIFAIVCSYRNWTALAICHDTKYDFCCAVCHLLQKWLLSSSFDCCTWWR